jgi:hypothetical protein
VKAVLLNDYSVSNQLSIVRIKLSVSDKISPPLPGTTMTLNNSTTLRHVVLFAFKDGATVEQIDAVVEDFGRLKERIPGVNAYEWGGNVSPEGLNQGYTHCFTLTFASEEDRNGYLLHAAHQAFVESLGAVLEKALVVDYWAQ